MKSKPLILFLFGLLSVIFVSPLIVGLATAATYTNVSAAAAKTMIDTNPALVVLDVRNQSEYDAGHIGNARLIPVWALAGRLSELNQSDTILVYCKAGGRSATASQTLVDSNFTYIYNMLGGITAWSAAAYPIYVNYSSIQAAIDNADNGGTIYVSSGLYYEHLTVNKSVALVGENKYSTIIDGTGNGTIFNVAADNVSISYFTIQNCGCSCQDRYGFYVEKYRHNISITDNNMARIPVGGQPGILSNSIKLDLDQEILIEHNNITQSVDWCILITNSSKVQVLENSIVDNWAEARIENSTEIVFSGNNVASNPNGVDVINCNGSTFIGNIFSSNFGSGISFSRSRNNLVLHNSFVGNGQHASNTLGSANSWNNSAEGNYWSNYTGVDADLDGIGDTLHLIDTNNTDYHPFMGAFSNFKTVYGPQVDLISNSSISSIEFSLLNSSQAKLKFNVTGENGTQGFCRICIPKELINGSYVVTFDGEAIMEPLSRILPSSNDTYTYLYISYTHSQHMIEITGTTAIPEFSLLMIPALIVIYGLLVATMCRRKRSVQ
jgi:parallel beta-helix repeat protein